MKCLLSAGAEQSFNYPKNGLGICFEQWGNAWHSAGFESFYRDGLFLLQEINDLANECDVLFLELLPKQWEALGRLRKPCKARIFGVAHAPPHNLEVEVLQHKAMMIEAWQKCDFLVAMDIGFEYYIPFFASESKLIRLPHPVPVNSVEVLPKLDPKRILLFHIMEPGHHDFDNYLTLKIIESVGAIPRVIVRNESMKDISFWLRKMEYENIEIQSPVPHSQFCQLVSQCYAVCQIAGRPSLGRTAADAARVGTISIASEYWYQRFLFPDMIVKTPQEMVEKYRRLNEYTYRHIVEDSKRRLKDYSPQAIGKRLLDVMEREGCTKK
jgi:hypothetical protein